MAETMSLEYISVRISASPAEIEEYVSKLWPSRDDVFWCNHPKHDDNHSGATHDHAHIIVPYVFKQPTGTKTIGEAERDALKVRINRTVGLKGSTKFATTVFTNGYLCAMTYMKHVPGAFIVGSTPMKVMFESAPPWVENREHMKASDESNNDVHLLTKHERHMMLSETNIIGVMRKFARLNKIDKGFAVTLADLIKKTRWRLSTSIKRNRISQEIVDEFESGTQACARVWVDRYMPYRYQYKSIEVEEK